MEVANSLCACAVAWSAHSHIHTHTHHTRIHARTHTHTQNADSHPYTYIRYIMVHIYHNGVYRYLYTVIWYHMSMGQSVDTANAAKRVPFFDELEAKP